MSQILRKAFIFLYLVNYDSQAVRLRNKFVYEKEISEHCLRRVVPSVFLGRQAIDAYSQVLYFSKVDLPYSCFISVRAESGSNIILVVQLLSGEDLKVACDKDPSQLLVYELGETFGGYWGPQELIKKSANYTSKPTKSDLYTLKHVPKTTRLESTREVQRTDSDEGKSRAYNKLNTQLLTETQDFITIEVPLVNISGQFLPGEEPKETFFEDENFDLVYNVRPRFITSYPQGTYITTELPLVQFSMDDNSQWGYKEARNPFGQSWNKLNSEIKFKQKIYNRKNPIKLKFERPVPRWLQSPDNTTLSSDISGEDGDMKEQIKPLRFEGNGADVISVEELLSAFNSSGSLTTISEEELEREVSQLLDRLSAIGHNQSAYMYDTGSEKDTVTTNDFTTKTSKSPLSKTSRPDYSHKDHHFKARPSALHNSEANDTSTTSSAILSRRTAVNHSRKEFGEKVLLTSTHSTTITNNAVTITTEREKASFTTFRVPVATPSTNTLNSTEHVPNVTNSLKVNQTRLEEIKKNTLSIHDHSIDKSTTSIQKQRRKNSSTTTGSLRAVDHESWDNVVRAAPVMAVRLDKTLPQKIKNNEGINPEETINTFIEQNNNSKQRIRKKRKKRFIQGIMIEDAKPHNLTTKEETSTTTASSIEISDIQQFAQLVELADDDIHDRAALRYLSQYVGRPMFNLCQYQQPKPRYVYLFNSSRLVISIGNFTLRRMQLVITPAKRLLVGKLRCEQSHLECQVNGNRVCIDAMSACDGVANCGETDIYDEDRLMCGGFEGLRHNVCLAAVTFLAVLLTLIYMVHYWLGRCVPKVSEAFFIYTEGDENALHLDSIMRSPNDVGFIIGKSFENFETDALFTTHATKESKIYSCIKKCFPCFFKKVEETNMDSGEWDKLQFSPASASFSFPELEIRKLMDDHLIDVSVQTGESLEMTYIESLDKSSKGRKASPPEQSVAKSISPQASIEIKRAKDELNRIKFFNKSRKVSLKGPSSSLFLDGRQESFTKPSTHYETSQHSEETEITIHSYDVYDQRNLGKTSVKKPSAEFTIEADVHTQKPQSKQLRFNEDVVNIPRDDNDSEEEISALQYDESKRIVTTDTFEEIESTVPSTSRDFKRFWGSKGKKKKKIQTLPRNY